jgi:hypothetical protein
LQRIRVLSVHQRQVPLRRDAIAIGDHFRNLERGVDVDQWKRDMAEERFPRQPEKHCAVLADRPQHAEAFERRVRLSQHVNASVFELTEMFHGIQAD